MFGYTTLRDKAQKQVPDPQWIFKRQTCDHPNDCRRLFLSWCERVMCWDVLSHSHISDVNYFFIITYHLHVRIHSRMRSKGSRFTLGVWGLRVCSLDVAFASATVRNRSQPFAWGPYGRAYGKFYRGGPFWRFQTSGCFVSRGRCGTSWHSDVFCNVSQVVLRGRRNTFATFSEDVLQFSWQAQHFGRVHRHFSWQAQHFRRVLWCVFCKSHWQGCVKWRQGANSVAGVAFSDMCWKLTEASHETSILRLQIFRF